MGIKSNHRTNAFAAKPAKADYTKENEGQTYITKSSTTHSEYRCFLCKVNFSVFFAKKFHKTY